MSSNWGSSQIHSRTSSRSPGNRSTRGSPPRLPAAPATYTDDQLDVLEEQNDKYVTQKHLLHALDHVIQVLNARGIQYGVMGGMSMILLGNQRRTTRDVDVAVKVKVRDLLSAFSDDDRVYIPRAISVGGSGVARIFVLTGRSYGENVPSLAVEVDLILNGNKGAPRELRGATNTYAVSTECGQRSYNILGLQYLFLAKLRSLNERDSQNDFDDLVWMSSAHPGAVTEFAPRLDYGVRSHFARKYAEMELDPRRVDRLCAVLDVDKPSSRSSSQGSHRSSGSGPRHPRY
ncbi:hypothetical protein QBC44DRAFT_399386 [Cladorrhinum sp. PSN332]|nr:hypothetical protein QBC44DRAFT_399386 [Cladorrhinum sp. PSN332]